MKLDEESFEARDEDDDDDDGENTKQSTGGVTTFGLNTGEKGTSSEEEENGEVEMIGNFCTFLPIEELRNEEAGDIEESDDDAEGGWVRVYQAGGANSFFINAPRDSSEDDEDDDEDKISGFMIL